MTDITTKVLYADSKVRVILDGNDRYIIVDNPTPLQPQVLKVDPYVDGGVAFIDLDSELDNETETRIAVALIENSMEKLLASLKEKL